MAQQKQYNPLLVFLGLAAVVLLPLLRPGYVLSVDMVFTPKISLPAFGPDWPFWLVLHCINFVVSSQIIQKVLLFGILTLSGYGGYMLAQTFRLQVGDVAARWAAYFAGVLYMFNPFVYSRFMAGQFELLLGYGLLPFFVVALWRLCERPSRRRGLVTALWLVGIGAVSLHIFGMAILAGIFVGALWLWRRRHDKKWRGLFLRGAGVGLLAVIVLCGYWWLPLLLGNGATAHTLSGFASSDLQAFATNGRGLGLLGNVLGLQGFWADSKNLFLVPQDVFAWWRIPVVLLWAVLAWGVIVGWRRQRGLTIMFVALSVVAAVLAIGAAGTFVAPLNRWLAHDVPFFIGYREPQKFVAILALAYAYFGMCAVGSLVEMLHKRTKLKEYAQTLGFVLCLVPILCAPLMIWGFHNQLHAAEYPVEWDAMNDRLKAQCTGDCQVLYLPWHLYMRYDFAGRIVADPAPKFFSVPIVASSDPELKGATPYNMTAAQKAVQDTILPAAQNGSTDMAAGLLRYHIQFILLAKEDNYKQYGFLGKQQGIRPVFDTPTLTLYQVTQGAAQ